MRYLYYCNSAYQLLTVLNLHWHRKNAGFESIEDYDADLLMLNSFEGAKEIFDIVKRSGTFTRAFMINKAFNSGRFHSIKSLIDVFDPKYYLRSKHSIDYKTVQNQYSVIAVPKYSTVTAAIWQLNKNAKLHIIEDGTGTYFGSMRLRPDSRSYRLFYKTVNHGKTFFDYDFIYLNNKKLFTGEQTERIREIPHFDKEYLETVRDMFSDFTNTDDLKNKSIYYFAQFLNNRDINIFIDDLLMSLSKYEKHLIYIPHPRHKDAKTYPFDYAKKKQIWEMRLTDIEDINKKLLISIHSTACFTPKVLFDEEPYLLLFYNLCDDKVTTRNERFDEYIEKFKEMYGDKSKIMIPNSLEEFYECLDYYVDREKLPLE